jgi:hypothetical protein
MSNSSLVAPYISLRLRFHPVELGFRVEKIVADADAPNAQTDPEMVAVYSVSSENAPRSNRAYNKGFKRDELRRSGWRGGGGGSSGKWNQGAGICN